MSADYRSLKDPDVAIRAARIIIADGDAVGPRAKDSTTIWTRHVMEHLIEHLEAARHRKTIADAIADIKVL